MYELLSSLHRYNDQTSADQMCHRVLTSQPQAVTEGQLGQSGAGTETL